ncbi:MAG: response regulator transcription factor [Spirochaetia bacterium]|nr:response regulator transcription factor [Spirochaetia bacterium]
MPDSEIEKTLVNDTKIALVEDDDSIRQLIELNLKHEKYQVHSFFSTEQLERKFKISEFDILLLDIMLPGENGLIFAERLNKNNISIPILFISALGQEDKIQKAYELGAIDYIVKPFSIETLLAKIRNLLKHFIRRETGALPSKIGKAVIDWDLLKVKNDEEILILSPKEAEALTYFIHNPNKIITRKELISQIWGSDVFVSGRNIDNFLVKFRRFFEENPASPKIFITYPRKGYAYIKEKNSN